MQSTVSQAITVQCRGTVDDRRNDVARRREGTVVVVERPSPVLFVASVGRGNNYVPFGRLYRRIEQGGGN